MNNLSSYTIIIENPKGSFKSFVDETDPESVTYPLKGVTYPVDYGYIEGYMGEDDADLDIFIGTGELSGYMKVWRLDIPVETKFITNVTAQEFEAIKAVFAPVMLEAEVLDDDVFAIEIERFKVR